MDDGAGPIQFSVSTPSIDIKPHIDHALSLGLPEADAASRQITVIANGPTALEFDFDALRPRHKTLAINGALKLFTDRGLAPTYWIACDPQELVTGFLDDIPLTTIYLVASKCHPSVFERLRKRSVRLWHVSDHPMSGKRQVPCASSVTICAMMLLQRLGFTDIDVWGWDLCYAEDGSHHAGVGALSVTPDVKDVEVGDGWDAVWFKSNPTWCCEAEDALRVLPVVKWCGTDVRIHGRSLLTAIDPRFGAG